MSKYSGLVRAKESCHVGGVRYNGGDVFLVTDLELWADDPFVPVHLTGEEEVPVPGPPPQRVQTIKKYAVSRVPVRPAIERMPPEHRLHAGLRKDA